MQIDKDSGLLVGAPYKAASDVGGPLKPEAIVIHYTGGGEVSGSVAWLTSKDDVYVSAHCAIGRDGSVIQMVPFNVRAYHAGVSEWNGRKYLNGWSIGIELANWGRVNSVGTDYVSWAGTKLEQGRVIQLSHRSGCANDAYWETYTQNQVAACAALCARLCMEYSISAADIVGHDAVAPGRKLDPGPALDMVRMRRDVAGLVKEFTEHPDEEEDPLVCLRKSRMEAAVDSLLKNLLEHGEWRIT